MSKRKPPADSDDLTETITIRLSPADRELLDAIVREHAFAKRGAVAREALRRGLASLQADDDKDGRS